MKYCKKKAGEKHQVLIELRDAPTETDTETSTGIDQELLKKLCPPYKVILHNCDCHGMDEVVIALLKSVSSLTLEEAIEIMETADRENTAVVIVAPQETAEFYQERIQTFKLGCTIEPDN